MVTHFFADPHSSDSKARRSGGPFTRLPSTSPSSPSRPSSRWKRIPGKGLCGGPLVPDRTSVSVLGLWGGLGSRLFCHHREGRRRTGSKRVTEVTRPGVQEVALGRS